MAEALIFLPGFLGQQDDFDALHDLLTPACQCQTHLWPKPQSDCRDIADYAAYCWQQLHSQFPDQFYIYGYSMGGRLLMHWLDYPQFRERCLGVFIAASHTGLREQQKSARQDQDEHWAQRFATNPLPSVLSDWYQQPVFGSLSDSQKQQLIHKRSDQGATGLAQQLVAASLARQHDLSARLTSFTNVRYLVGARDEKFLNLASSILAPDRIICIPNAGHMAHLEQPDATADAIRKQLQFWRQQR